MSRLKNLLNVQEICQCLEGFYKIELVVSRQQSMAALQVVLRHSVHLAHSAEPNLSVRMWAFCAGWYEENTLVQIWALVTNEYPELAGKACRVLLPFSTSYLCECGFSALAGRKTKKRPRSDVEHDYAFLYLN